MNSRHNYTSIGEGNAKFCTTQWSQIASAQTTDLQRQQYIINNLISRYWKPVYCTIRHKGFSNEDAKDLTQSFFEEIVLNKELIQKADRTKGRFRTFLLTALDHYISNARRLAKARKRRPQSGVFSFQIQEELDMPFAPGQAPAEAVFNYTWACDLIEEVLDIVKKECVESKKSVHWQIFNDKVVTPIISGKEAPDMADLCAKYDLPNAQKASNMIVTVKRTFQRVLESLLAKYAPDEQGVEEEFGQLLNILSKPCAI
jgi:RNA polymerase sigma-70 factor (ECF subfamily)